MRNSQSLQDNAHLLSDLCTVINGLWKGKKEPFVEVGVIRNANFSKDFTLRFDNIEYLQVEARQYATRKLQKGDLIVEKSGGSEKQPVGRCVLFDKEDGEFSFSNFTSVLRIKDRNVISPEYLYKYLLFIYRRGDTRSMQRAATGIHNIEFDKFLSISIPVPPLPEQQKIVDYLDGAFAKIDQLKANAEKQLEDAQSLFSAALEEAMSPKEGWEEKTLGEICSKIGSGATPKGGKKVYIEKGVSLVRSMNVRYGLFDYTELAHINDEAASKLDSVTLNKDDVLFNITGASIARCCVLPEDVLPARVNQHVCILRIKEGAIPQFLCYCLISKKHQKELLAIGEAASTRQALTKADMEKHLIMLPNKATQQSIVSHLDALSAKVNQLKENYKTIVSECDALKQALLREIFE